MKLSNLLPCLALIIGLPFINGVLAFNPNRNATLIAQNDTTDSMLLTNNNTFSNTQISNSYHYAKRYKKAKPPKPHKKATKYAKYNKKRASYAKTNYNLQKENIFKGCDCKNNNRTYITYNQSFGDSLKAIYCYSDGITNYKIAYSGKIIINEQETDIISISPGGYLKFSKTNFGNTRGVIIESNKNGELLKEYYVGKKQKAWDPDGKEWFANVLPEIIRNTGLGARERAIRIYSQSGLNGILNEISNINSSSIKSKYYRALFMDIKIPQNEVKPIMEKLKNDISSNYEKSDLLKDLSNILLKDDEISLLYFNSIATITSSYEKSTLLQYILSNHNLNDYQMGALLYTTQTISSNYEKSNVLISAGKGLNYTNILLAKKFFSSTTTISSSYDKSNVLNAINLQENFPSEIWLEFFDAIKTISSNYEKSNVLIGAIKKLPGDMIVINAFLDATGTISSNYDKSNVLTNLVKNQNILTKPALLSIIKSASLITGDNSKYSVLQEIINIRPKNDAEIDAAIKAAINTLASATYKADLYSKL